jgi:hypothetical protein
VKSLLYLKSPQNTKQYLIAIQRIKFKEGDKSRNERWGKYPPIRGGQLTVPINQEDLLTPAFMNKRSNKLSFDISRFTEFLSGYNKVDEDIKPVMLHYAMIYLFDFFSRTWLKYEQNRGHGIHLNQLGKESQVTETSVTVKPDGIFQRAVDAFYFVGQSSLFSLDNDDGIGYTIDPLRGGTISQRIRKIKYSATPSITLARLIDVCERFDKIVGNVSKSNPILVGYVILFTLSSICRYRAEDWFKIRGNRDLKTRFELLQHDFLYEWIPEILMQTILTKGLKEELPISE